MPLGGTVTSDTTNEAGVRTRRVTPDKKPGLITQLLSNLLGKGKKNAESTGPAVEERIEPVAGATDALAVAGQTDLTNLREANEVNQAAAVAEGAEQKVGQQDVIDKFDESDTAAQTGLEDVQATIEKTRDDIDLLPEKVQGEFDRQQVKLDAGLEEARTGIAGQRGEALSNVMQGRAGAMDAAVAGIHGATRQQMADIDAQVQQGILSPSQATAMKAKIKMGASMQLSAAVGQTAQMFTKIEADTATSFGNMFTQFEGVAQQTQGQFGGQAAGAFGEAQAAKASFNAELTKVDAQVVEWRNATLSQNAAARGAFENANDIHNTQMLDYMEDKVVLETNVAISDLGARQDLARMLIQSDMFTQEMEFLRENQDMTKVGGIISIVTTLLGGL